MISFISGFNAHVRWNVTRKGWFDVFGMNKQEVRGALDALREEIQGLREKNKLLWSRNDTLQARNEDLRVENEALRAQIQALEDNRGKQWENLLGYDGRPQRDNLGGVDDGQR